jgi:hypothetical protein
MNRIARLTALAAALHALAACTSTSVGAPVPSSTGTGASTAPGAASSGASGASSPSRSCSTDGSDRVVAGSYAHDWSSSDFNIMVFVPNCEFCWDALHSQDDPYGVTLMPETWTSAWSADHSEIVITLSNGTTPGRAPADASYLVDSSATTNGRLTSDVGWDMRTCDGYTVVSATDYFR